MSISAVRRAIADYLNSAGASIPGLSTCYRAMPTFLDPSRWWVVPAETGTGTLMFLHLARTEEDRIAYPAVAGQKFVEYVCAMVMVSRYPIPSGSQAQQYEGDEWVDGLDATIEAVKAWVRADPNLGTGSQGVIWQAGQSKGDLSMTAELPYRDEDAGEVLSFNVLEMHVTEVITA